MKEVDDTPVPESESECPDCAALWLVVEQLVKEAGQIHVRVANLDLIFDRVPRLLERIEALEAEVEWLIPQRIEALEAEVADLHHRRRVSRQQAVDQDPEWH